MLAAALPAYAGAATPAAIDQYVENAPGNLGNPGGENRGPKGGKDPDEVVPALPGASAAVVAGAVETPAVKRARRLAESTRVSVVESGGGTVPLLGYPWTPFLVVLLILALIAAAAAAARWALARWRGEPVPAADGRA